MNLYRYVGCWSVTCFITLLSCLAIVIGLGFAAQRHTTRGTMAQEGHYGTVEGPRLKKPAGVAGSSLPGLSRAR